MSYVENGIGQLAWTAKSFTPNIKSSKIKSNTRQQHNPHKMIKAIQDEKGKDPRSYWVVVVAAI